MHNHTEPIKCEHKLKYCDHCDVVYCTKCKREWEQRYINKQTAYNYIDSNPNKFYGICSHQGGDL